MHVVELRRHIASLLRRVKNQQESDITAAVAEQNDSQLPDASSLRQSDDLLTRLQKRGPGFDRSNKVDSLWHPVEHRHVSDEPGVMGLLASDWARWWSTPPVADGADLAQWLRDINFPVPPVGAWVWRPSGDDVLSCIRSCPNTLVVWTVFRTALGRHFRESRRVMTLTIYGSPGSVTTSWN